jgi:hypothetical protein
MHAEWVCVSVCNVLDKLMGYNHATKYVALILASGSFTGGLAQNYSGYTTTHQRKGHSRTSQQLLNR